MKVPYEIVLLNLTVETSHQVREALHQMGFCCGDGDSLMHVLDFEIEEIVITFEVYNISGKLPNWNAHVFHNPIANWDEWIKLAAENMMAMLNAKRVVTDDELSEARYFWCKNDGDTYHAMQYGVTSFGTPNSLQAAKDACRADYIKTHPLPPIPLPPCPVKPNPRVRDLPVDTVISLTGETKRWLVGHNGLYATDAVAVFDDPRFTDFIVRLNADGTVPEAK